MVYSNSNIEYIAPLQTAADIENLPKLRLWLDANDISTIWYDNRNGGYLKASTAPSEDSTPVGNQYVDTDLVWEFGAGDVITFGNNARYQFASRVFTAECYVKVNNPIPKQCIMGNYASATAGWSIFVQEGLIRAGLRGDTVTSFLTGTDVPVNANQWHHVALTHDGTYAHLYVNGTEACPPLSATAATVINTAGTTMNIGRWTGTAATYFTLSGEVTNVRLVSGIDLYSPGGNTFTPPSVPLGVVSGINTTLLTLQQNPNITSTSIKDYSSYNAPGTVTGVTAHAPNPVYAWQDKSPTGINQNRWAITTQPIAGVSNKVCPGYIINRFSTKNSVIFNGTNQKFDLVSIPAANFGDKNLNDPYNDENFADLPKTSISLNESYSHFFVYKRHAPATNSIGLATSVASEDVAFMHSNDNDMYSHVAGAISTVTAIASSSNVFPFIGYASAKGDLYLQDIVRPDAAWAPGGTTTNRVSSVGLRGTAYHNGDICEIVHIGLQITDYERDLLAGFLSTKWGSPLV